MIFSITKSEFLNDIQNVSHAISKNSPQVALRGIKIEASNDQIQLTASDADISIRIKTVKNENNDISITEEGSALIEAQYLLEIVRKIDAEKIIVEVVDGALTKFYGGSAIFKINGMRADDYPVIDFSKPSVSISVPAVQLQKIIEQTSFAASSKDTRPVLTGVNFKMENGILKCTATDSYRLAKKTIPYDSTESFNITIPALTLNDVRATMLSDLTQNIEICISEKKVQFVSENMILQSKLLDGGYPETDRLIPVDFSRILVMRRNDLISAIDRTIFIKNDNMTINRLSMSENEVVLTNRNQEIGESSETLQAEYSGEPMNISFAGNYVMSAARALDGTNIKISFTGDMKPFILTCDEDESILQLVLPVRTYN